MVTKRRLPLPIVALGGVALAAAAIGVALNRPDSKQGFEHADAPSNAKPPPAPSPHQLAAGMWHSCLLDLGGVMRDPGGVVQCCGRNVNGVLGDDTKDTRPFPAPVGGLTDAVEIAAGGHTCARLADGGVACWGENFAGQLGDGTKLPKWRPVRVPGLSQVAQIAAGGVVTCARQLDGAVWCWGKNESGALGDGTTQERSGPTRTTGVYAHIAVGAGHVCGVLTSHTVACWGDAGAGQVGDGSSGWGTARLTPTEVKLPRGAIAVAAGGHHSCALLDDGEVACWGSNEAGQLGDGTAALNRLTPTLVPTLSGVAEIEAGYNHSCARMNDGTARCWGKNESGELGDGTTVDRRTPTKVTGLSGVVELSLGEFTTCARLEDKRIACWGANTFGQLCNGTEEQKSAWTVVKN